MNYDLFLMPLLTSFVIAASFLIAIIFFGKKGFPIDARIQSRHIHQKGILRFGGVALIVAFVAAVLLDRSLVVDLPLKGLLIATLAILVFGVIDDLRQMSWQLQLLFQIVLVVCIYFVGIRLQFVSNPFGGIFLLQGTLGSFIAMAISIGWVVFLMNALNWVDGVDGVAGGITLVGAVAIFFLSLRPEVNQPPIGIIAASLIGGLIAFILLNFYPAKIIAGTSGSMFMGFMLAVLAIFAGAKIATTLLVLAVPIMDAFWVIGERLKMGASIFSPDKRHLHFRLLELGWSVKKICFFYYSITVLVAVIALNTRALGKLVAILLVVSFILIVFVIIRKRVAEKLMINEESI
jgi:UDP-GlcNAc:undecaprenyl-phosphate GlcNAc-1-phosphate transferase